MDPELLDLPGRKGDVRYFLHVHPNKRTKPMSPTTDGRYVRLIEGKCRPMVILGKCWWFDYGTISEEPVDQKPEQGNCDYYTAIARPGYLVVELRSECPAGREKMHSEVQNDLLKVGKASVVSFLPVVYPAEAYRHGPHDEIRSLPSLLLEQIRDEIVDRGLRGDIVDPQVVAR